jgi:hypothetical protein
MDFKVATRNSGLFAIETLPLCSDRIMNLWISAALFGASTVATAGKDVRDIELRRLFEPTPAEQRAEASGRIYIYEGLRETDVARAMEDRVRSG